MAKYVDDGFLTALVVRARGFCTGEFHSQINPEIAQAYLDAAEALGADPNKGNITINDIRKEAETKLSSVEDKNAFWKDQLQDRSGFAEQLATLGLDLVYGVTRERDFDVGSKLMIAAATAGYNEDDLIDRVVGLYEHTTLENPDLADLWNQRSKSYKAAEKSRLEKFATSSLKMFPKELCKILETMSDNDVLNLMQIYDQHLSQSHDAWEKHSLILNMALTARETERIVEITSQAERELSNNLENMFKAFEESDLGDRATVLNVMQMTQEDMSTEHRTKLERGRLIGRVEIPSFMRLKMIDANEDEQGEKLHFQKITEGDMKIIKQIGRKFIDSHPELLPPNLHFSPVKSLEVSLPKKQQKFTVADLAKASERPTEIPKVPNPKVTRH